jgi:integrase
MKRYPGIKELAKLRKRGRVAVGHGAFLQISEFGTRSWVFRYVVNGKAHHVGLGSCTYVTLAEARQRAFEYRRLLAAGGDPLEQKRAAKRERLLASVPARTFQQVALEYIAQHEREWRSDHSRRQWRASLTRYAFPKIGSMAIADVDVAAVLSVLDPISARVPETASRVKHRMALILDWAAARELRPHDNPARRPRLLPKHKNRVRHFEALPYADIGAFMVELREQEELSARALEFLILTASRTGELLGARWEEINGDTWTIPDERTKSGRAHRVPLSDRAVGWPAAHWPTHFPGPSGGGDGRDDFAQGAQAHGLRCHSPRLPFDVP